MNNNTILCEAIVHWLENNQIDYCFTNNPPLDDMTKKNKYNYVQRFNPIDKSNEIDIEQEDIFVLPVIHDIDIQNKILIGAVFSYVYGEDPWDMIVTTSATNNVVEVKTLTEAICAIKAFIGMRDFFNTFREDERVYVKTY